MEGGERAKDNVWGRSQRQKWTDGVLKQGIEIIIKSSINETVRLVDVGPVHGGHVVVRLVQCFRSFVDLKERVTMSKML